MKILITNDDGYRAKGIQVLVNILKRYGEITVVAPKYVQSGASMGVTMGYRPIAVKKVREEPGVVWYYLDGSPASCVKFGIGNLYTDGLPDLLVSGINHGGNYATAALYSGTLGAAQEGALVKVPSVAVSLDSLDPDADFSVVERYLPPIFKKMAWHPSRRFGLTYNINFPAVPPEEVAGVRVCKQGVIRWVRELYPYDPGIYERKGIDHREIGITSLPEPDPESEEMYYVMGGEIVKDPDNSEETDVELIARKYITVTAHSILTTDQREQRRLRSIGLEEILNPKA